MTRSKNMTINANGGQVNIANDNSMMNIEQNNCKSGLNANELNDIIRGIIENVSGLKKEDADGIIDAVGLVKDELAKPEPKAGRLRNCLTLIAPMFTVANGIPALVENLQRLVDYVTPFIR